MVSVSRRTVTAETDGDATVERGAMRTNVIQIMMTSENYSLQSSLTLFRGIHAFFSWGWGGTTATCSFPRILHQTPDFAICGRFSTEVPVAPIGMHIRFMAHRVYFLDMEYLVPGTHFAVGEGLNALHIIILIVRVFGCDCLAS